MKKFFNDNMWWMVIIAIAVGAFALYRTFNKKEENIMAAETTVVKES